MPDRRRHPRGGQRDLHREAAPAFADAGVTDVSVRVVPIGEGRDELVASFQRTRAYLALLDGQLGLTGNGFSISETAAIMDEST